MFEHKTDPARIHRKELNKEIKRLRVENSKIRKGILVFKNDPLANDVQKAVYARLPEGRTLEERHE